LISASRAKARSVTLGGTVSVRVIGNASLGGVVDFRLA
jgi:hypothetical protein